jgi:hypothetical protein
MEKLIPFATLISTGKYVSPEEVLNGEKCGCVCPACAAPMVAKQGSVNVWHFAHKQKFVSEDKPCFFSFPRGCFWLARQLIEDSLHEQLHLPDYFITLKDPAGLQSKTEIVTSASAQLFEEVHAQPMQRHMNYDEVVLTLKNSKLTLVLGFDIPHKRSFENATVFVNLSGAIQEYRKDRRPLKDILLDRIFHQKTSKTWLFHPREIKKRLEFDTRLKEVNDERKRRAEARFAIEPKILASNIPLQKTVAQQQASQSVDLEERLIDLIGQAERLFTFGNKTVQLCDNCCYMSTPSTTTCQYCQSRSLTKINLSDEYFKDIKGKYLRAGYVLQSLKGLQKNIKK